MIPTPESLRQTAAAMEAHVKGLPVQFKRYEDCNWTDSDVLCWNLETTEYRLKPVPITRPWTKDEVPEVCWLRKEDDEMWYLVTSVREDKVYITLAGWISYQNLAKYWFWSPNRKEPRVCLMELQS